MMMRSLRLAACVAWAGFAISMAAPADAIVVTNQFGFYAACGGSYETGFFNTVCSDWEFPYRQLIKFNKNEPCNSGGCFSYEGLTYTSVLYTMGRKPTTLRGDYCPSGESVYELGTCAC
jgi:hypothetical protein